MSGTWKVGQTVEWFLGPRKLRRVGVVVRVLPEGLECRADAKTNPLRRVLWSCRPALVQPASGLTLAQARELVARLEAERP